MLNSVLKTSIHLIPFICLKHYTSELIYHVYFRFQHFCGCGKVVTATVARKRDAKNPGKALSMGYGFVQFRAAEAAQQALKELQHSTLDGHNLELKMSERTTNRSVVCSNQPT